MTSSCQFLNVSFSCLRRESKWLHVLLSGRGFPPAAIWMVFASSVAWVFCSKFYIVKMLWCACWHKCCCAIPLHDWLYVAHRCHSGSTGPPADLPFRFLLHSPWIGSLLGWCRHYPLRQLNHTSSTWWVGPRGNTAALLTNFLSSSSCLYTEQPNHIPETSSKYTGYIITSLGPMFMWTEEMCNNLQEKIIGLSPSIILAASSVLWYDR